MPRHQECDERTLSCPGRRNPDTLDNPSPKGAGVAGPGPPKGTRGGAVIAKKHDFLWGGTNRKAGLRAFLRRDPCRRWAAARSAQPSRAARWAGTSKLDAEMLDAAELVELDGEH